MCGICGIVSFGESVDQHRLATMTGVLTHRGPDDEGFYIDGNVGFGFRRLSIIDLETGHQPLCNEDGSIWIVFNGEIYNYKILRNFLIKKGHKFQTRSDTEVIVHLYEEYGDNFVQHLRGMFSIGIWDKKKRRLLLVRDRFGIKPLFYTINSRGLIFGSEMKSILAANDAAPRIDLDSLYSYLRFKYVPEPETIFKNIYKLPAGHMLALRDGNTSLSMYWDLPLQENPNLNEGECFDGVMELLEEVTKCHLMSDVPVGAFLSGGIDSSILVAFLSKFTSPLRTFTMGFEEKEWDESSYASQTAKKFDTEHHHYQLEPEHIEDVLPKLVWHFDEPFGDSSAIPTYYISKFAREHVKVVISGDGADELFAGYTMYQGFRLSKGYQALPGFMQSVIPGLTRALLYPVSAVQPYFANRAAKVIEEAAKPLDRLFLSKISVFSADMLSHFMPDRSTLDAEARCVGLIDSALQKAAGANDLRRLAYLDTKISLLNDMLVKVDRVSMASSLEVRVPYLDHKLVEFVCTIPGHFKLRGLKTKYLMRKIAAREVSEDIAWRKKQGFCVPVSKWFREGLEEYAEAQLLSSTSLLGQYLDRDSVQNIMNLHKKGSNDYGQHIWLLLVLELWLQMYTDAISAGKHQAIVSRSMR